MSQIPVILPAGSSNPVKVAIMADETGTVNVQVVQLGMPDQGQIIADTLSAILNELKALRIDQAAIGSLKYEPTNSLIDSTNN